MRNQDSKGLILLALVIALVLAAGWYLMDSGRLSMRENASPGAENEPAPQPHHDPGS